MLKTLVTKEILNNLLNLRFVVACFATTVLLVGSAAVMLADYLDTKKEYDLNRGSYQVAIASFTRFSDYIHRNLVARPPQPLALFAAGGERLADDKAVVHSTQSPYYRGELKRSPLPALFPSLDMVFVVGVILSLLVLMLTYDAVAGEREEGALRLLLAGPVPRDLLIVAKWLGGYLSVALPLAASIVVVLLLLVFAPQLNLDSGAWLRIGLMVLAFLVYLAVVFTLGLMVSVLFRRSQTVALALLLLWAAGTLVLPGLSVPAAHAALARQGLRTMETASLRTVAEAGCETYRRDDSIYTALLAGRDWRSLTDAQRYGCNGIVVRHGLNAEAAMYDTILAAARGLTRQEARIENAGRWLARLSPFGCLQSACVSLAGTGMRHELALQRNLEDYAAESWRHYDAWTAIAQTKPEEKVPPIGQGAPAWQPAVERLGPAAADALLDIGLMSLMGVLFFLAAYLAFLRTDVT